MGPDFLLAVPTFTPFLDKSESIKNKTLTCCKQLHLKYGKKKSNGTERDRFTLWLKIRVARVCLSSHTQK